MLASLTVPWAEGSAVPVGKPVVGSTVPLVLPVVGSTAPLGEPDQLPQAVVGSTGPAVMPVVGSMPAAVATAEPDNKSRDSILSDP